MKKYARIQERKVVELFQTNGDITQLFHPSLVWIEVTDEDGAVAEGWSYDNGQFQAPTSDDLAPVVWAQLLGAVQAHLDAAARDLGYDDIKTAVTYADEPAVPKFQAEGKALRAWRSLVWGRYHEIFSAVQDAARAVPTHAELLADLPKLSQLSFVSES